MSKMFIVQLFAIFVLFDGSNRIHANSIKGRLLHPKDGCGYSKVPSNKIVGGSDARPGAWPWVVRIGYISANDDFPIVYRCGGSLITSRHVLTAAHCAVQGDTPVQVRLGEHDSSKPDEHIVDVDIVRIAAHPQFNKPFMSNDIAILLLENDVEFTDRILPVCLPLDPPFSECELIGTNPFIIGWGRQIANDALSSSDVLQQLQIPIIPNSECEEAFKRTNIFVSPLQFDESAICAGYLEGGKDACKGDSGGPMMLPQLLRNMDQLFAFFQYGIVSIGKGCADANTPGLYTKVSHHSEWIKEQIAAKKKHL